MGAISKFVAFYLLVAVTSEGVSASETGNYSITVINIVNTMRFLYCGYTHLSCVCTNACDDHVTSELNLTLDKPAKITKVSDASLVETSSTDLWFLFHVSQLLPTLEVDIRIRHCTDPNPPNGTCAWTKLKGQTSSIPGYFNETLTLAFEENSLMSSSLPTTELTVSPNTSTITFTSQSLISETVTSLSIKPSSEVSTGSAVEQPTVGPGKSTCMCPCVCTKPISQAEMDKLTRKLIREMTVAKDSTAKSKRSRNSASDKRWISRGIGCVGVLVMTLVFGTILIGDVNIFVRNARVAFRDVRGRMPLRFRVTL